MAGYVRRREMAGKDSTKSGAMQPDYSSFSDSDFSQEEKEENEVVERKVTPWKSRAIARSTSDSDDDSESMYSGSVSSSDYDSDDSDYNGNVIGRCFTCFGRIFRLTRAKVQRNGLLVRKYSLLILTNAVIFLKSQQLRSFLVGVFGFIVFMFRFVAAIIGDMKRSLVRLLTYAYSNAVIAFKFTARHLAAAIKFALREGWRISKIGIRLSITQGTILLQKSKDLAIGIVRFPFKLGRFIVNAPWILYDAFWENTHMLMPITYGIIGWFVVVFIYAPILGFVLYALDILTLQDLEALGLKSLCITLGLIPEEKTTFLQVASKLWNRIFY